MSREALLENVTALLADAGFLTSERCAVRPKGFDLAARSGEDLLLVKVLGNVDAFDAATGGEMRRLGTYLSGTPMVIGLRTRDEDLKPGVVYFRHGVPAIHPDTLYDLLLEDVPPLIYAAPGGLYVNIDGELVEDERKDRGWSLGRLADELGVSRRTVAKYEDGMNASVEVAVKLEEMFDKPFSDPVSVMEGAEEVRDGEPTPDDPETEPDSETEQVHAVLSKAGFVVHPTERAPFKAVGEDDSRVEFTLLSSYATFTRAAKKRAKLMASIGRVTRTRAVFFTEDDAGRDSVDGTALVARDELDETDDADRLRELIRERSEEPQEA
ncbi:MAG: transcriptional regulator [Halobaculum sp.]